MTTAMMATPIAMALPMPADRVNSGSVTIEMILALLKQLQPEQLRDVLQFVQFLEYQAGRIDPAAEDETLWAAAEENERYAQKHPDEPVYRFKSRQEFLEATVR